VPQQAFAVLFEIEPPCVKTIQDSGRGLDAPGEAREFDADLRRDVDL